MKSPHKGAASHNPSIDRGSMMSMKKISDSVVSPVTQSIRASTKEYMTGAPSISSIINSRNLQKEKDLELLQNFYHPTKHSTIQTSTINGASVERKTLLSSTSNQNFKKNKSLGLTPE